MQRNAVNQNQYLDVFDRVLIVDCHRLEHTGKTGTIVHLGKHRRCGTSGYLIQLDEDQDVRVMQPTWSLLGLGNIRLGK